jgi:hypothetical protein
MRWSGPLVCASFGKHLVEPLKDRCDRCWCEAAEPAEKPFAINRAELVQSDEAGSALKPARHSPGVPRPAGRHRSDDDGAQVLIELVR